MKKIFTMLILTALVAIMGIGCCACRKGKNNKSLTGQKWHLVRMMERDLQITPEQFLFTFSVDGKFSCLQFWVMKRISPLLRTTVSLFIILVFVP